NPAIDIAYIYTGEPSEVYRDTPEVLDDVLVMGYPRVALFLNFLTAEMATISTMVKARMTPSRGSIAATAKTIWTGEQDLLLITAKIKGGNSGGPIINNRGCVVGVAFADPSAKGLYDEIGYGVGMPIQVLEDIIAKRQTMSVNFIDWKEE
ncbi:MAG: trypsin-like peptidase domain-containing protein, partial [Bacteroidales bacterium]|nr:trypsin-like peptidase domain-containing protein [Bacteroidales bacterium]